MTEERKYYSIRTGKHAFTDKLDLPIFKKLILSIYQDFQRRNYFQEVFGYNCVDAGFVPGIAGEDIDAFFLRKLRKVDLFPIEKYIENYYEEDLFDIIELLFDLISKPVDGNYHSWSNCGWHYTKFDKKTGQSEFLTQINPQLNDYQEGYELSSKGEILLKGGPGLQELLTAEIPRHDPKTVDDRVKYAVQKFRRHRASIEEKQEAVRLLADVLEFLRPQIKQLPLTKDEGDLFNIANNFGIRHHKPDQKTDYDQDVYLDWIFYSYLSTIHLSIRIIKKQKGS